jgi:hypothetical protein
MIPKFPKTKKLDLKMPASKEQQNELGFGDAAVYIKGAQDSLLALLRIRTQKGAWFDQETEAARESLAYKTGEALDSFFRFYVLLPKSYPREELGGEKITKMLYRDFSDWLSIVVDRGFVPSPYLYTLESWQSTEFASFAIGLCRNAHEFFVAQSLMDSPVRTKINNLIARAIKFFDYSCLRNKDGMSWSICEKPSFSGTDRSDTYSTSRVVLALSTALSYRELFDAMSESDRKFTRKAIEDGCQWMLKTIDGKVFQEFPGGGMRELGITIAALHALAVAPAESISETQRKRVEPIIEALVESGKPNPEQLAQNFFLSAETEGGQKLSHDPRWSWSSVPLIAMASMSEWVKSLLGIERNFYELLSLLHAKAWKARDSDTGLWVADNFGIGDTYRGIIATILYALHGRPRTFNLTEGQIREALQDAVVSEAVFYAVLRALDRIQRIQPLNSIQTHIEEHK